MFLPPKGDLKLNERCDFFYQTLNDSGTSFTPTTSPCSVNNLFATTPIPRYQRQQKNSIFHERAMTQT
jgi:hypothetical protein